MRATAILRHRTTRYALVLVLVAASVLLFGAMRAGAREAPDCGQNAYEWNAVGGFYGRAFDKWCFEWTYDFAELAYDGLKIDEATRLTVDEATRHAFEVQTSQCLGGPSACPGQTTAEAIRIANDFEVWKVAMSGYIGQLDWIHAQFQALRATSGHGSF